MATPHQLRAGDPSAGFTLVEIMVVIAIIAITARLVAVNLSALIPSTKLDAAANEIMGRIDYMRSEAQLQGKIYTLEFDIDNSRWRIVMPPEERLISSQNVGESQPLDWDYLEDDVRFGGFHTISGHVARSGVSTMIIDENGYTADVMIYLRMKNDQLDYNVWTIRVRGLDQRSELLTNVDSVEPRLDPVEEGAFR